MEHVEQERRFMRRVALFVFAAVVALCVLPASAFAVAPSFSVDVRFYQDEYDPDLGPYDSVTEPDGYYTATIDNSDIEVEDDTYGAAFWNNQAGGFWRVTSSEYYVPVQNVLVTAASEAGVTLGTYWASGDTLSFLTTDSATVLYPQYHPTYQTIVGGTKTVGGTPVPLYQGWDIINGSSAFTNGASEPALGAGGQSPAVLALSAWSQTIPAISGVDAKTIIDAHSQWIAPGGSVPVDAEADGPVRYVEGGPDGAGISSGDALLTWGRRFPDNVTTLVLVNS